MKAKVTVTLRKEVLDPQGKAVSSALEALGFAGVADVRVGKYIEIAFTPGSQIDEAVVKDMCEKLLANPVMEDYRIELGEDGR